MTVCLCCNKTHKSCRFGRHGQPDGEMCYRHQLERKVWELSDDPLSEEFQSVALELERLEFPTFRCFAPTHVLQFDIHGLKCNVIANRKTR